LEPPTALYQRCFSSRESDEIVLEDCLSMDKSYGWMLRKAEVREKEKNGQAQFHRAEKIDEGMALKT
jgi:hypothetical protein